MHRLRVARALQVGVNLLGDERRERRRDFRELDEDVAERPIGEEFVRVVRRLPETAAAAADIPVRQILDELDERPHGLLEVVDVHRRRHVVDERLHRGDDPAVEEVRALRVDDLRVVEVVDVRVGDEERVGVPPRDEQVAHQLLDAVLGELQRLGADDGRVDHVEPDRVRPVGVEHEVRVGVVLQALRHLLAVLREDEAVDDDVFVGALVEEARAQNHERVEPAACLIQPLRDEVSGEELGDFARPHIMLLRIRHRATFEPAVEHLGRAVVGLAILRDDDLVDDVFVEIRHPCAGEGLQLRARPNADHVRGVVVVDPDGDAAAPEAVARNVPITRLAEPVAKALFANVVRRPVDGGVVPFEPLVEILDADIPRIDGAVDERRVGAVAIGVGVRDRRLVDELATPLQILDDVLVAVLAEASLVVGDLVRERARGVERIDERGHAGLTANAEVVLAVSGRDVDEARAVVRRHVIVVENAERALGGFVGVVGEDRLVARPLERVALERGDDFELLRLLENGGETRLRHHVNRARVVRQVADGHIVNRRARANHQILRQRPRRGRPDEKVNGCAILRQFNYSIIRRFDYWGPHRDRRILHILVVRAGLEVGKRRRELPRVGHDAVGAVDAALVPELLEDPPNRLHEIGIHRLVVVVEVDPATHARDGLAPFGDVFEHHRAALLVELVDAERLDLVRPRDVEGLLGERLDGEAVRVPAEAAFDIIPAHRLVARHDVLDRAGEEVSVVGQARGKGRAVVERVARLALVPFEGLLECVVRRPGREDCLLHLRERDLVGNRFEHRSFDLVWKK